MISVLAVGVVDDDRDAREALALLLETEGMRVRQYASAEDYLVNGGDEACLVTDLEMPRQSGLELLRALRSRGDDIPVILMTGRASPQVARHAIEAGMHAVMAKPLVAVGIADEIRLAVGSDRCR